MTDRQIFEEMARRAREGQSFVLATVIASSGSSPRKAGAKMLILPDGTTIGSVGGGRVELETLETARLTLEEGVPRTLSFTLTEDHGYVCGGAMEVYIEPHGSCPRLIMFGAGHVGRAVGALANSCGFRVALVDERPECTSRESCPFADEIFCCPAGEAFSRLQITADTLVVIATPGHVHDFAAVRGSLGTAAGFIGLLGSRRKREALLATLREEGYGEDALQRIFTPVGLAIGAQTPEELAVSIVGQLIQHRRGYDAASGGHRSSGRNVAADGNLQAAP